MKLTSVEIENFRCFERLTLSLEPDVTAVIGINAAGKTALLDAIALALRPLIQDALGRIQASADPMRLPSEEVSGLSLQPADVRIGTAETPWSSGRFRLSAIATTMTASDPRNASKRLSLECRQEMGFNARGGVEYGQTLWVEPVGIAPAPDGFWLPAGGDAHGAHIDIPTLAFYRDSRNCRGRSQPQANPEAMDRDSALKRAFDAGADFEAAQRWFYMRENQELRAAREHGNTAFEFPDLATIRKALSLMLDGVERVYTDDNPPRLKVDKKDARGQTLTLELAQLSAGQRNLLALTLDFARRLALTHPGWDQPLEAPGILLIDEIELNLHPKWQQSVIPHLRRVFPDTQIIVATHSPQVLSTLEARQIRMLKDQQLYVPNVETYGTDAGRVQRLVMDTDTRPPDNPYAQRVDLLFAEIGDGRLEAAERLLQALESERRGDEPSLIEARTLIANRKWEAELGL